MEALGAAGVCIGDWVEQHKRVLGTKMVVGPDFVLQAATIRACDEQLTFDATNTFAHIRVTRQVFAEVTWSCLSDMIYPIMEENANLLGCTLELLNADTDALVSVFRSQVSPKVEHRSPTSSPPFSRTLMQMGKEKPGANVLFKGQKRMRSP